MTTQMVFKRHELKYLMNSQQYIALQKIMQEHMSIDEFGKHCINNVYYDTTDYLLIRRSIEKPCYKEKLRIRSYGENSENVFVEVKKKYDGIVYKRRISMPRKQAYDFLSNNAVLEEKSQISKEIEYFVNHYQTLKPMIAINYKREAYYGLQDSDFRMTFDTDICMKELKEQNSKCIVSNDTVLLEIKTGMGIPMWLLDFFAQNQIYKTSFSKYGKAYEQFILPKLKGELIYVA
ncbi:MAG: polyphosphate polymerase domain-containing protein [Clostridia bacterium]